MEPPETELLHAQAEGLEIRPSQEILSVLLKGQIDALECVKSALPQIEQAALLAAKALASGKKIAYAAAGSSALMALADALELPGTFGIESRQIAILMAGGMESLSRLNGYPEDNIDQALHDVANAKLGNGDCLIAVSASGTTPYVVNAALEARARGTAVIAIANNPDAPLLNNCDVAILIATPAELIAGSTRMGAATAQKVALNMLSTLMAIDLGHTHDGQMVNFSADNEKLRARAIHMVVTIGKCSEKTARLLLEKSGGSVKLAILMARGANCADDAMTYLDRADQNLRLALSLLREDQPSPINTGACSPYKLTPQLAKTGDRNEKNLD